MDRLLRAIFCLLAIFCGNLKTQMIFPEPILPMNGSVMMPPLMRHGFPYYTPFPVYNPFQSIVPLQAVTPPVYAAPAVQTCICVPIGSCTGTVVPATPIDGAGLIDIRIVNNPTVSTPVPAAPYAGLVRCCLPGPYQCGVRYPPVAHSPAAGPGQATYGKYPLQAVLLGPGDVYQGSGVLIDALNVLTTAHKVANYTAVPNQLRVRMGEWNAAGDTEPLPAQEFLVSKIFVHPNFNPASLINDVAVLRLAVAVPLGEFPTIATACLPTSSFISKRCWVSGWGKNDFHGVYQTIQKEVDVTILDAAKCQAALSTTRLGAAFVFDSTSFVCTGGEQGKDACTGDGGSPLVCEMNGHFFVTGLAAWGIGCASSNIPGVYVNVASFISFIHTSTSSP